MPPKKGALRKNAVVSAPVPKRSERLTRNSSNAVVADEDIIGSDDESDPSSAAAAAVAAPAAAAVAATAEVENPMDDGKKKRLKLMPFRGKVERCHDDHCDEDKQARQNIIIYLSDPGGHTYRMAHESARGWGLLYSY